MLFCNMKDQLEEVERFSAIWSLTGKDGEQVQVNPLKLVLIMMFL